MNISKREAESILIALTWAADNRENMADSYGYDTSDGIICLKERDCCLALRAAIEERLANDHTGGVPVNDDDWKEMTSKDWARHLYLQKHGSFSSRDIMEEPDAKEALSMPCRYPGCRTKTNLANSNLCPAHHKRWESAERDKYVIDADGNPLKGKISKRRKK